MKEGGGAGFEEAELALTGANGRIDRPRRPRRFAGPSYSRPRLGGYVGWSSVMKGGEGRRREGVTQLVWDRWSVVCNSLLQRREWEGQESVRCLLRKRASVPLSPYFPPPTLLKSSKISPPPPPPPLSSGQEVET